MTESEAVEWNSFTTFSTVRDNMNVTEIGRKSLVPVIAEVLGTGVV